MMPSHIVLDTSVLFAGTHSRYGASFALLNKISAGEIIIHLSVPLMIQYQDVLVRNAEVLGISEQVITAIIDRLCAVGTYHDIHFLWRPSVPDQRDELVLELAVSARCSHIVTHNVRDFRGAESFGITPITPVEYLRSLRT